MEETHVYHHNDEKPRISVKAEKNTKGYNYEASVTGCESVEQAMAMLDQVMQSLARTYGAQPAA